ncbi:MAG: octanoyltransferase, partial [Verrucomicrobiota bacterium]|nr:octanoyltransferase [Verrucomicrobiota bacterium]
MQELHVYHDREPRAAAINMALDEALFEYATVPLLRFYSWARPSLSFGYFGLFAEVADQIQERDIVRRWTGGGIVLHGTDLTYSVILP